MNDTFLIEPEALQSRLRSGGTVVIDCGWYAPETKRSGRDEFAKGHVSGARFFDLDAASDPGSTLPNMLPPADHFARYVGGLGIGNDTSVVVYDATYVSARVWWMFRRFGHRDVRILDGGWRRWTAEGRPVETGAGAAPVAVPYVAAAPDVQVADWRAVLAALRTGAAQVVDARTRERFTGELPSGYPGLPSGHMPGAINLPWNRMIRQSGDFAFEDPTAAARIFREAGVDPERPIICTCGSGVTAAVLAFQLTRLGCTDWSIYDASWNEWGRRPDLPRESL